MIARGTLPDGTRKQMESLVSEQRAQTGKIIAKGIEKPEPIAAAVNLEALNRTQTFIRLYVSRIRFRGHLIGGRQRLEDGFRHAPLDFSKRHKATDAGACIYVSALSASA